MNYKTAGVDIEKAESSLKRLKQKISDSHNSRVLKDIGLFGGFYELPASGYQHPVLVASTDGVGTKLKVAILSNRHNTVGQDLVHHCINDIAVCGAKPLFFLDYYATGKLNTEVYEAVVGGIAEACQRSNLPLIGGETAEMPDFYSEQDYDLCGTIIGIVEKEKIIDGKNIRAGDILVGVASNGLHTNGYSLARRVLLSRHTVFDSLPGLNGTIADELLKIHINYYPVIESVTARLLVKGISHITGGGIVGNTRRLLPEGLNLEIQPGSWPIPEIFTLIQKMGQVPGSDMMQAFNMGIGLIFIIDPGDKNKLFKISETFAHPFYEIGKVV